MHTWLLAEEEQESPNLTSLNSSCPSIKRRDELIMSTECFLDTLRYFEFRKIQRTYGGAILSPNRHPMLSIIVFILWAIIFLISIVN